VGDIFHGPSLVTKNQALFGILAVLYHLGGKGFPLVSREIYGEFTAKETLGNGTQYIARKISTLNLINPVQPTLQ